MTNQLVMALGLTHKNSPQKAAGQPVSFESLFVQFKPKPDLTIFETDKASCILDSYEDAEKLIAFAYKQIEDADVEVDFHLNILLIPSTSNVSTTKAMIMLGKIEQKQPTSDYPIDTYITPEIYDALAPHHQDLYRGATQVGEDLVHQRFQEGAQRCFIISPIGEPKSSVRERADYVFKTYVKPACEGASFRPVRADMMLGGEITSEMLDALQGDPIVIVYLGSPKLGWNPNVMYELGLRHDAPYIALKDLTSDGQKYVLPFDIHDTRVVEIPECPGKDDDINATVRTIRERIKAAMDGNQWSYLYPNATVDLKFFDTDGSKSKYIEVSPQLETLFELRNLKGKLLSEVIEHLIGKMPEYQRSPFLVEQNSLVTSLAVNMTAARTVDYPYATVPIVFETHKKFAGRAFLPVIVRYQFFQATNILRLRIIYVEVTTVTIKDSLKKYFTCTLKCDTTLKI